MEFISDKEHVPSDATRAAEQIEIDRLAYDNWTDYLTTYADSMEYIVVYDTLLKNLDQVRMSLAQVGGRGPRGSLKQALMDIKNTFSADSLRHGYLFGMMVNNKLFSDNGVDPEYALDRLSPYIDAIFDDIQDTSGSPVYLAWMFRLFGDNFYANSLAHTDHPDYNALNSALDPLKPVINSICAELYPNPTDDADFAGYERQEIDTDNFKHGFAIARRAYNMNTLPGRSAA